MPAAVPASLAVGPAVELLKPKGAVDAARLTLGAPEAPEGW